VLVCGDEVYETINKNAGSCLSAPTSMSLRLITAFETIAIKTSFGQHAQPKFSRVSSITPPETNPKRFSYISMHVHPAMLDIFAPKLKNILAKGTGTKIALFDSYTKPILSSHVPHTTFLKNEFFLFQMLTDTRCRMQGLTCVIFAQPTSIYQIVCELREPKYGRYIVFFTSRVDEDVLEIMARSDTYAVVSEVYEMNIGVVKLDDMLYRVGGDNRMDGIMCVLSTLGICPKMIATAGMKDTVTQIMVHASKFANRGTLIMLNRSFDPYTPLVHEWRYQPMIYEYLGSSNGIVTIDRTYVLNDAFFELNKFLDINTVSANLREFVTTTEKVPVDLSALSTATKTKESLEKHLKLHNHIVKHCVDNKEISEIEMKIIRDNKMSSKQIEKVLSNEKLTREQKCKLVMIYLLRNPHKRNRPVFEKYTKAQQFVKKHTNAAVPTFREHVDIKLAYEPVITSVLGRILKNKIDGSLCTVDTLKVSKPYVIYIDDITFSEYRAISLFFRERNILDYVILCDRIVNYADMLNDDAKD
ncbi:Vacuolar sorting protein VPS45/Stt10 (Sec1 family), partial [Trachipleistophora hominis]